MVRGGQRDGGPTARAGSPLSTAYRRSAAALVTANLVLAALTAGGQIRLFESLLVYWLETWVIAVLTIPKILTFRRASERPDDEQAPSQDPPGFATVGLRTKVLCGFLLGMAIFLPMLGLALAVFFAMALGVSNECDGPACRNAFAFLDPARQLLMERKVWLGAALLAASHVYSFITNYIGQKEYLVADEFDVTARAFGRLGTVWLTIFVAAFSLAFAAKAWVPWRVTSALLVMGAKTFADHRLHLWLHRSLGARNAP